MAARILLDVDADLPARVLQTLGWAPEVASGRSAAGATGPGYPPTMERIEFTARSKRRSSSHRRKRGR